MKLRINGDDIEISADVRNVADLLKHFQLQEKVVIVEHNREILEKSTHQLVSLTDGDQIEIVHFVGGG
ncbi:sulfur carrier protein [Bacillus mesophilus]|uniref:Thiamine biosynthesis protein ThiS n=1 Tax=Bacillus mesophilus TaxID=1808955 RepID=A0A6M0Q3Q6_9BACI|nr:sulfur carrier protein ThiS [Bacillus mesophilus]MBM7659981.1 sulfur carrier protein [Bacillus mesophilus]NEY70842.1 thiamine biosynthesis protein ThiS [Bacillus mesophilus]